MTPRPDFAHRQGDDRPRRRTGTDEDLIQLLTGLDNRTYGAYKSAIGDWDYGDFRLAIDYVQADPYAPPSSVRAITTPAKMGLPSRALASTDARLATADHLVRVFEESIRDFTTSGDVRIARAGQEILQRSSCTVTPDQVEIRFQVQLPAQGRSILGRRAARLFDEDVPDVVLTTLDFISEDAEGRAEELLEHIYALEDHRTLQRLLVKNDWVTFVANGSVLARRSGISQEPLKEAIPFMSPKSLETTVTLPHAGEVTGMAVPRGVTVIVGGGYHGKSTLLGAIQRGVNPHIPGDGREKVATLPDAMKVRATDGRAVTGVNVSPFIQHLPGDIDTARFSTENASGSTSQAAAIMEAVELGAPLLLVDEDTSATNLLIRDARMRDLVAAEKEPITPLVDRIGALSEEKGVSTILVMGGSGDYLDVADRVIMLDEYHCLDVTERAKEVVSEMPRERNDVSGIDEGAARIPMRARGVERPRTKASGVSAIILDKHTVDLTDVEQIVDPGQTEAIAWAIRGILEHLADAHTPLPDLLDRMERLFQSEGLDAAVRFGSRPEPAFLVRPRRVDIGAAINRYRGLTLV
ncbi:MAG: ABC-ATPase domain-containing protein [Actinomycetaceae bacterium]|nr:ABC-ATPase domain-containing protein [Actinomycetaceae bacterium]